MWARRCVFETAVARVSRLLVRSVERVSGLLVSGVARVSGLLVSSVARVSGLLVRRVARVSGLILRLVTRARGPLIKIVPTVSYICVMLRSMVHVLNLTVALPFSYTLLTLSTTRQI